MHCFLRNVVFVFFALVTLFTGSAAHAEKTLITDPPGDAIGPTCQVGWNMDRVVGEPVACEEDVVGRRPSEPSVDIVAADFRTRADVLIAEITVLDLDHPGVGMDSGPEDSRTYEMSLNTGGPAIVLRAERAGDGTLRRGNVGFYSVGWSEIPTPPVVLFDDDDNLVRIEIPFQAINDVLMPMCPYCDPVERGTVARWPAAHSAVSDTTQVANASFTQGSTMDAAETDDTYTVGR